MTAELATFIKNWRAGRGIPATEAARLLGVPVRTLQGIEQGRGFSYPGMLMLAIEALDRREAANGHAS